MVNRGFCAKPLKKAVLRSASPFNIKPHLVHVRRVDSQDQIQVGLCAFNTDRKVSAARKADLSGLRAWAEADALTVRSCSHLQPLQGSAQTSGRCWFLVLPPSPIA